jgi:glycosyltransferase involved in cell wall biosynthesis
MDPQGPSGRSAWPRISLVTTSFNQAEFVEQTIRSVLAQGYPNLEYMVMDGGSTDGSPEIIQKYAPFLTYWTSGPDGGQAAALNEGFRRAHGEILGFVNSDDLLLPGALAAVAGFFAGHPETELLIGKSLIIDSENRVLHRVSGLGPTYYSLLFWGTGGFTQPSSFWRREAFLSAGPFDPSLRFSFDYDFYLRLAARGPARHLDRYLAAFRQHSSAKSSTLQDIRGREDALLRILHGLDRFPAWVRKSMHSYYSLRYLLHAGSFKLKVRMGMERLPWPATN